MVERLRQIIRRIDKASDEGLEVIVLEQASAAEVVRILTTLEQANSAANKHSKNTPKIVADKRTNSVLINGDKATRLRLRTLIAHLDTPIKSAGNKQKI